MWAFFPVSGVHTRVQKGTRVFNFSTLCVFTPKVHAKHAPKVPIRNMWGASHINVPSGQNWKWDRLVFHFHVLQLWTEREGLDFMAWKGEGVWRATQARPHARTHTLNADSQIIQTWRQKISNIICTFLHFSWLSFSTVLCLCPVCPWIRCLKESFFFFFLSETETRRFI